MQLREIGQLDARWNRHPTGLIAYRLGRFFLSSGNGDDLDYANFWIRRAATLHYAPAEFELGRMYLEGKGEPANRGKACYYLARSASHGYRPARAEESEASCQAPQLPPF